MTKNQIEEIIDELEIDHEPGGGGWIDSYSKRKVVDEIYELANQHSQQEAIAFFNDTFSEMVVNGVRLADYFTPDTEKLYSIYEQSKTKTP